MPPKKSVKKSTKVDPETGLIIGSPEHKLHKERMKQLERLNPYLRATAGAVAAYYAYDMFKQGKELYKDYKSYRGKYHGGLRPMQIP